jgi:hypothetical protein
MLVMDKKVSNSFKNNYFLSLSYGFWLILTISKPISGILALIKAASYRPGKLLSFSIELTTFASTISISVG